MDVGTGLAKTPLGGMRAIAVGAGVGVGAARTIAGTGTLELEASTRGGRSGTLGGTKGRPGRVEAKRRSGGRRAGGNARDGTSRREMAGATTRKTPREVSGAAQMRGEEALVNDIPGKGRIRRHMLAERQVVRHPIGGPIGGGESDNELLITDKRKQEMRAETGHGLQEQGEGGNPGSDVGDTRATTAVRSDVDYGLTIGTSGERKRKLLD